MKMEHNNDNSNNKKPSSMPDPHGHRQEIRNLTAFEPCVATVVLCVCMVFSVCVHVFMGEVTGLCKPVQWGKKRQLECARTRQSGR